MKTLASYLKRSAQVWGNYALEQVEQEEVRHYVDAIERARREWEATHPLAVNFATVAPDADEGDEKGDQ